LLSLANKLIRGPLLLSLAKNNNKKVTISYKKGAVVVAILLSLANKLIRGPVYC
jgi:hypothetical protein